MTSVRLQDLKNNLSRYLARFMRVQLFGRTVLMIHHSTIIALTLLLTSLLAAGTPTQPAVQSAARKPIPFSQRASVSLFEAVASIRGKDVAGVWAKNGPPELLKIKWLKKIGLDKNDEPTVLVTLHNHKRYTAQVLRFYGIDGEKYHPQFELVGTAGVFEPLQHFGFKGHWFVLVWFHNIGSAGGGPQWVLWENGPEVRSIPYSDPADRIGKLIKDGESRTGCWYLKGGHKALSFAIYTRRAEQATVNVSAVVRGTFRLITDSAGRPLRFEVNSAKRHPMDDIPPKSPAAQPGNKRTENRAYDLLISQALQGKGDGAKLSPREVVGLLVSKYKRESRTREWEMLNAVGQRMWVRLARQVAGKFPDAVRQYASTGSEIGNQLALVLGEVGGEDNINFLAKMCANRPSRYLVLALGRTESLRAWPTLRMIMTGDDEHLAYLATETLARAGDKQIIPTLEKWLTSGHDRNRLVGVNAAMLLGAKELVPALRKADPLVKKRRELLYRAMVSCGNEIYLDKVHEAALDDSEYIRTSQEKSPDPAMINIIWNYRQNNALTTILKLKSPRSLSVLDKLAGVAKDPKVRKRAGCIAEQIRHPELARQVAALIEQLRGRVPKSWMIWGSIRKFNYGSLTTVQTKRLRESLKETLARVTSRPSTSTRPTTTTSAPAVEPAWLDEEPLPLGGVWDLPAHDPAFKAVPTKELPAYVLGQKVLENPSWLDQHGNTRYVEPFRYAGLAGQEKALNVFIARLRTQADRQLYQQLVKDLVSRLDAPTGKDTADTWAVKFLARLGARGALRQMLGERKDPFDRIGREMLMALSQVGDQRDVPLLIALAGREDQASAALVNKALGHMMAASPLPLQQNGRTDAAAWQVWWDYRPGEGLLSRAEAAAARKSAMRKIEFMPEAFAAIIVPAETRTVEMVERSTQPGVPDKRTLTSLVISYRLSRYVTLRDVWVGYSQGHGATLIDARTGRWPKPDAGEQGRISAVMATTPAQKALLEKAQVIRARFPNGGVKMWEELADLLGPGMTVQDVELILAPLQFNSMMFQGAGWGCMGRPEEGVSVGVSNAWTAVDRRLPVAAWPINAKPHVRLDQDAPAIQPTPGEE